LHAEVVLTGMLANLVNRDDLRVVQVGDRLRLILEPPYLLLTGPQPRADHLQSDGSIEAHLSRLVDHPHPASTEDARQLVVAEMAAPALTGEGGAATGRGGRGGGVLVGQGGAVGKPDRLRL